MIQTNGSFRALFFFCDDDDDDALFGGGGGLSKSALSFHDKTHFCDDDF